VAANSRILIAAGLFALIAGIAASVLIVVTVGPAMSRNKLTQPIHSSAQTNGRAAMVEKSPSDRNPL